MSEQPNLLGLDPESLRWRRLICEMAAMLVDATLVGNPAPKVERMQQRLRHPQSGDYVYETSTFWRGRGEDGPVGIEHQCGFLERAAREPRWTEEEWAEEQRYAVEDGEEPRPYSECPTEEVWYIRYGPNPDDVTRWHNADFRVVPLDRAMFEHPLAGVPDGKGAVVFTRDSLLGSLADSGFHLKGDTAGADARPDTP